jgi:hypothetical protein
MALRDWIALPGRQSVPAGERTERAPIRIVDISTLLINVSVNSADIGRVTQGKLCK